jgi:hypothetical protein
MELEMMITKKTFEGGITMDVPLVMQPTSSFYSCKSKGVFISAFDFTHSAAAEEVTDDTRVFFRSQKDTHEDASSSSEMHYLFLSVSDSPLTP